MLFWRISGHTHTHTHQHTHTCACEHTYGVMICQMFTHQWQLHGSLMCTICYSCAMYASGLEYSALHQSVCDLTSWKFFILQLDIRPSTVTVLCLVIQYTNMFQIIVTHSSCSAGQFFARSPFFWENWTCIIQASCTVKKVKFTLEQAMNAHSRAEL